MATSEPNEFDPGGRVPLSVLVARQLRERIVTGSLPVGAQLPSENELREQHGVSRSTVREALRILQAQGLLSGADRVSTTRPTVSDARALDSAATALENALRLRQVPLPDLVELRVVLEGAALAGAAAAPASADLAAARASLAEMRRAQRALDVEAFHRADVAFHVALVAAGGNVAYELVLGALRESIAGHLRASLAALAETEAVLADLLAEHAALLAAVERGDADGARRCVTEHIRGFYAAHGVDAAAR